MAYDGFYSDLSTRGTSSDLLTQAKSVSAEIVDLASSVLLNAERVLASVNQANSSAVNSKNSADLAKVSELAAAVSAANASTSAANARASELIAVGVVSPYLGALASVPTTRRDGSPLQVGDTYLNTTNGLEYIYKSGGWVVRNLDGTLLATSIGSSLIGRNMPILTKMSDLLAYSKTSTAKQVYLSGYYTHGDVGIGVYSLDEADTTSASNGGTIVVANDGGRWKLSYSGHLNVKWFGAKGDGVTDDTAAFNSAISVLSNSTGGSLYIPLGTYVISSSLSVGNWPVSFIGSGVNSSKILYKGAASTSCFSISVVPSSSVVHCVSDLSVLAGVNNLGSAFRLVAQLTSASVQVNGQNDTLRLTNVTIDTTDTGYWAVPIYSQNNGGIHTVGLKIQGREGVTQNNTNCKAIMIENTDVRVAIIRALMCTDTYIVRYNQPVVALGKTGGTYGGIESIYFIGGEVVGCGNTAVVFTGTVGAVQFVGVHFDAPSTIIDASNASTSFMRFVSCDFRQEPNGLPLTPGPMMKIGDAEMITAAGCHFSGGNAGSPNSLYKAFSFAATTSGTQARRMSVVGCTFRNLWNIFSSMSTGRRVVESGNSYSSITNGVYEGASNSGNGISRYSSNQQGTIIFLLDTTGSQWVNIPITLVDSTTAPSVAILQVASDTGTDKLDVRYDLDSSTNTNARFLVRGNTVSRNVRFSWYIGPLIQQDISA